MTNYGRVRAAQKRAKKLIDKYEALSWEVKPSVKARVEMDIPKNISAKKAQALIDNMSAQTIRTTMAIKTRTVMEETTPIEKGSYKSGAKIYDVVRMDEPETITKENVFNERNVVNQVMKQIRFVMENAPSRDVAQRIEDRLNAIELHGSQIFNTDDMMKRRAALLDSITSEKAILKSVKKAEQSGYPASLALTTLYEDLVEEYGTSERGLAARQLRQFQKVLDNVGHSYSSDENERNIAANVLRWLIENAHVWDNYRRKFKLKGIQRQIYDSNSLLTDVSDAIVDYPEYRMKILNYLTELMSKGTEPWDILDKIEEYVEELKDEDSKR